MALTSLRSEQISDIAYTQGLRVITISNITLSGGAPSLVDGVTVSVGDRVLVTGQSTGSQNGIYQVQTVGSGSNGTWIRSADTNATGELEAGTIVMVTEGTSYADTQWKLTTNNPIVIGTTALTFEQNSAFAFGNIFANGTAVLANSVGSTVTFTAGNNIAITGNNTSKTVTIGVTGISLNSISNGTSNVNVVSSGGNITVGVGGTGNVAVFAAANIVAAANLLPAANVTYDLGSTSARWKDLWLSNSTLYLADTAIATTAGVLTVNGANVLTGNAGFALSTTGNVTGGNVLTGGVISATGTITSAANVIGGNIRTAGVVTATGNITGGNLLTGGLITATSTITSAANITGGNLLTAGLISATANITGGNILTAGLISATGTITSAANVIGGNISTAGIITATGNVTGGNIRTAGLISATGNITGANLTINGSAQITGNLTVSGTETIFNVANLTVNDKDIIVANNVTGSANIDGAGIQAGNPGVATWFYNNATLSWQSNVGITPTTNGTLALGGASNFWGNAFLTTASVTGNVQGGNIRTAGLISATGAITGSSFSGAGTNLTGTATSLTVGTATVAGTVTTAAQPNITSVGTLSSLNSGAISSSGNITTAGQFIGAGTGLTGTAASLTVGSATAATTAGTVTTAAQPNITSVGTLTSLNSGAISSSGNITGANLSTTGLISATGNITGGNINTVGGNLSGNVSVGNIFVGGYYYANGVAFAGGGGSPGGANTQIQFNDNGLFGGTAGLTFNKTTNAVATTGTFSATGNITGGNLIAGTGASGNITGANVITANTVTITANITAGNILTAGSISAAGNITGLNLNSSGADLAEKYVADSGYTPGTVVDFGGTNEITISTQSHSTRVAGIVSTSPGHLMNADQTGEHVVAVALIGRVPCLVLGPVTKGDLLVAGDMPGHAQRLDPAQYKPGCIIGKSLEDHTSQEIGCIEVAVGRF